MAGVILIFLFIPTCNLIISEPEQTLPEQALHTPAAINRDPEQIVHNQVPLTPAAENQHTSVLGKLNQHYISF